jgi:hypothetical protein
MRVLNGSVMKECGFSRGLGGSLGGTEINTGFSTTQKINNAEFLCVQIITYWGSSIERLLAFFFSYEYGLAQDVLIE